MMSFSDKISCGAQPLEARRGGRAPGLEPQRGPTLTTGGRLAPYRGGARRRVRRQNATGDDQSTITGKKPLNILQWNGEGISKKKVPLTERLHKEDIDIACIQETHLTANLRFTVRGYESYRLDREGRHKGGVIILVRNNIPAVPLTVNTNDQAEINGVDATVGKRNIKIYNLYGTPDRALS